MFNSAQTNFIFELSSPFLLTTCEPSLYRLLLSLVTFDTREGLEEEGRGATIHNSTVDPRPAAVHLPQLREVAPAVGARLGLAHQLLLGGDGEPAVILHKRLRLRRRAAAGRHNPRRA